MQGVPMGATLNTVKSDCFAKKKRTQRQFKSKIKMTSKQLVVKKIKK